MSREATSQAPAATPPDGAVEEEVDAELLELPAPPRRAKYAAFALMVLTCVVSLAMVWMLRNDVVYAFRGSNTVMAKDLYAATTDELNVANNMEVHSPVRLGAAGGIRFSRPIQSGTFRVLPIAGRDDVWVELHLSDGEENGRWVPPKDVKGRLIRFDQAGLRHRGLAVAIERARSHPLPANAWLLVAGSEPTHAIGSLVLAAMFLAFAGFNAVSALRLMRPVK